MTSYYFTILMNQLENMQIEVTAASESAIEGIEADGFSEVFDCNRFLLVTGGRGTLILNGQADRLEPGVSSIILAGTPYRTAADPGETLVIKWVHFRTDHSDRELYNYLSLPDTVKFEDAAEPAMLLDRIAFYDARGGLTARLRMKAAILELISLFLENMSFEQTERDPTQELLKIGAVLKYIDDHLSGNITVEVLAKQVFLHPNYFIAFFKGVMGCSPIQFVNQRRMETARVLLQRMDGNVSDVADRVGMKIHYFSRMFKAHTGFTPSRYRKLTAGAQAAAAAASSHAREGNGTNNE